MVLSYWRSPAEVSSCLLDFDDSSYNLQAAALWLCAVSGHVHRLLTNYNTLLARERETERKKSSRGKKNNCQEQEKKLASFTPFLLLSNWHWINAASASRHTKSTGRCLRSGQASFTCHLTQALAFPSVSAVWTERNKHQGWTMEVLFPVAHLVSSTQKYMTDLFALPSRGRASLESGTMHYFQLIDQIVWLLVVWVFLIEEWNLGRSNFRLKIFFSDGLSIDLISKMGGSITCGGADNLFEGNILEMSLFWTSV